MKLIKSRLSQVSTQNNAGYTLVEALIVVVIIGIAISIVVPSWLAFRNRFELTTAQGKVLSVLKQAQGEAKLLKSKRQVSFRMQGRQVQWAVHDVKVPPSSATWHDLSSNVIIDPYNTTLYSSVPDLLWQMQFSDDGSAADGKLGRLTLTNSEGVDQDQTVAASSNRPRRCVLIAELLGTLQEGKDQLCTVQ